MQFLHGGQYVDPDELELLGGFSEIELRDMPQDNSKLRTSFEKVLFCKYNDCIKLIGEYYDNLTKTDFVNTETWIIFTATPRSVLEGNSLGLGSLSKGAYKINKFLGDSKLSFKKEHSFKGFLSQGRRRYRFDFAVFSDNQQLTPEYLIEFDGEQHYKPVEHWGGQEQFEKQQLHDRIKDEYCKEQGIPLIRIPYWEIDNIEQILSKELAPLLKQKAS